MTKPSRPLFVLMARDRPCAVILRRGPSDWFHVISWDTAHDRFEHGAWVRGRIYEDRCDLSPDGELLLTFVMQGRKTGTRTTHAWTAISRPPWLHALALWPQGTTYGGGGRFTADRSLVLRSMSGTEPLAGEGRAIVLPVEVSWGNPPVHTASSEVEGAEWSGRDQAGHLVFTRGYSLMRRIGEHEALLADFAGLAPDPKPAPKQALTRVRSRR